MITGWSKSVHSSRSGKWNYLAYVNIPLCRQKLIPNDPSNNKGSEVPITQINKFMGEWNRVSGGTQQSPFAQTQFLSDRYRWKYRDINKICSIADFRKVDWPNLTSIQLSKNVVTKMIMYWTNYLLCPSFLK